MSQGIRSLANKKLGQHFLKDQTVIHKIVDCLPSNIEQIIEVGPGLGALTSQLRQLSKPLLLIEKDSRFVDHWKNEQIEIIQYDAMKLDWHKLQHDYQFTPKSVWLVSNLPYNISAPLTVKFLPHIYISDMTLMYQKEVAEKILGSDVMGSLHMLCSNFFSIKKVLNVKPGAFIPPPKVDSTVLHFKRLPATKVKIEDIQAFEKFLRTLFSTPRKQLKSVLAALGTSKSPIALDLTRRAETLTCEEVYAIYFSYQQF